MSALLYSLLKALNSPKEEFIEVYNNSEIDDDTNIIIKYYSLYYSKYEHYESMAKKGSPYYEEVALEEGIMKSLDMALWAYYVKHYDNEVILYTFLKYGKYDECHKMLKNGVKIPYEIDVKEEYGLKFLLDFVITSVYCWDYQLIYCSIAACCCKNNYATLLAQILPSIHVDLSFFAVTNTAEIFEMLVSSGKVVWRMDCDAQTLDSEENINKISYQRFMVKHGMKLDIPDKGLYFEYAIQSDIIDVVRYYYNNVPFRCPYYHESPIKSYKMFKYLVDNNMIVIDASLINKLNEDFIPYIQNMEIVPTTLRMAKHFPGGDVNQLLKDEWQKKKINKDDVLWAINILNKDVNLDLSIPNIDISTDLLYVKPGFTYFEHVAPIDWWMDKMEIIHYLFNNK